MKRLLLTAVALLGVWACPRGERPPANDADTLTRRQKDSIISTMPLPGASRIRDAQRAQDAATERNRILDSIGG